MFTFVFAFSICCRGEIYGLSANMELIKINPVLGKIKHQTFQKKVSRPNLKFILKCVGNISVIGPAFKNELVGQSAGTIDPKGRVFYFIGQNM